MNSVEHPFNLPLTFIVRLISFAGNWQLSYVSLCLRVSGKPPWDCVTFIFAGTSGDW
jgi:hypothetical protein